MGTHPIFESDFDCLTVKMADVPDPPPPNAPAPEAAPPSMPVLDMYNFACDFMAKNGWFILFGLIVFCLIKKNVDAYLLKLRDWWQVAQIKKDPDQFQHLEEDRMSRIERMQREINAKAAAKKARQDEIDAVRKEREEAARDNGGGKESMARWEAEQKVKTSPEASTSHTIRDGPVKPPSKSKPRLRGEYNPMTGSGGGACKFTPGRAAPKRGG